MQCKSVNRWSWASRHSFTRVFSTLIMCFLLTPSFLQARALPPASRSALLWRLHLEGRLGEGAEALLKSFNSHAQRVYEDAVDEERGVMDARMLLQLELDLAQLDMVHDR